MRKNGLPEDEPLGWKRTSYNKKLLCDLLCCGGLDILLSLILEFSVSNSYDFLFIDATIISLFFEFLISYFSLIHTSCFPPFY